MRKVMMAALAATMLCGSANAQIDQSSGTPPNTGVSVSVSVDRVSPFAQSFTPTLSGINSATFYFRNDLQTSTYAPGSTTGVSGPSVPATLNVALYSGRGSYTAANLLGTSLPTIVAAGANNSNTLFRFASTIALTPGQIYSLVVNDLTAVPGTFFDDAAIYTGATYAGGTLSFSTTDSAYFAEGLNLTVASGAVPEPASWAMMVGGFGLIGAAMRRRKVAVSFA